VVPLRALLLAALLTVVPVGIGVAVADDPTLDREPPAYEGTALADFDTTKAVVRRAAFCEQVHPAAVREALGGDGELTAYDNGQPADVLPGQDVAHEYGCRFTAEGAEARGWVFAPPVTAAKADALVKEPPSRDCEPQPGAPAYGAPSVAHACTAGDMRTVSFRGLFGDAWLSCSLTVAAAVPPAELLERAGRWCVAVAVAASAA
jgi:hypothetical protein